MIVCISSGCSFGSKKTSEEIYILWNTHTHTHTEKCGLRALVCARGFIGSVLSFPFFPRATRITSFFSGLTAIIDQKPHEYAWSARAPGVRVRGGPVVPTVHHIHPSSYTCSLLPQKSKLCAPGLYFQCQFYRSPLFLAVFNWEFPLFKREKFADE